MRKRVCHRDLLFGERIESEAIAHRRKEREQLQIRCEVELISIHRPSDPDSRLPNEFSFNLMALGNVDIAALRVRIVVFACCSIDIPCAVAYDDYLFRWLSRGGTGKRF